MSAEPIDFAAEGLLDGLDGEERAERLALLEYLADDGVALPELQRATLSGTLMFLPAERIVGGRTRYSSREISERTGTELEFLGAMRRAMSLTVRDPDEAVYTEGDLESAEIAASLRQIGISDEEILDLLRTLGRGLSQAAETMRALPLRLVLEPGVSEQDLSQRYAHAVSQLTPMLGPLVTNLLNLHLREMAQSEAINAAERSGGRLPGSRQIAVCFADLIGFTRLGEEVPPDELGRLAVRLEALANDVADQPVRLVKTIGDAAMLTSLETEPLLDAALRLLDAADAEGEDFPQLRAGAAFGPALSRAGDWFGRPVNLASRITQVARPGSLLAESAVHESALESYSWSLRRRATATGHPRARGAVPRPAPAGLNGPHG